MSVHIVQPVPNREELGRIALERDSRLSAQSVRQTMLREYERSPQPQPDAPASLPAPQPQPDPAPRKDPAPRQDPKPSPRPTTDQPATTGPIQQTDFSITSMAESGSGGNGSGGNGSGSSGSGSSGSGNGQQQRPGGGPSHAGGNVYPSVFQPIGYQPVNQQEDEGSSGNGGARNERSSGRRRRAVMSRGRTSLEARIKALRNGRGLLNMADEMNDGGQGEGEGSGRQGGGGRASIQIEPPSQTVAQAAVEEVATDPLRVGAAVFGGIASFLL